MRKVLFLPIFLLCLLTALAPAREFESKPSDPALTVFNPVRAPVNRSLILRKGDRLAICGDSITEQKMYSRLMEDYLTMCAPQPQVTVRQYGWSGERAPGFLGRMTNDCLRFKPTVATTCYGMNDHEYRPYEERIGQAYTKNSRAIIAAFRAAGARVILGSPGCVGKIPSWVKSATGTVQDLNLNLCNLRNIGIDVAQKEKVRFADVFWPMITAGVDGQKRFGSDFAIAGKDGVHPGWAGQTLMAYSFLKAMGLDGEIGTLKVDLKKGTMQVSTGHEVVSSQDGSFRVRSSRYVFCACANGSNAAANYPACEKDDATKDSSIRAAMQLIPFNRDLNRFVLIARRGSAASYRVRWGSQENVFSAEQLAQGINLAEAFPTNPFTEAFARVDAAVAAKQAFETKQIKDIFHGKQGKEKMDQAVSQTEAERAPLSKAIQAAMVPVEHTIRVEPL